MKIRLHLLLPLLALAACGSQAPTFVQTGSLPSGATILVRNRDGDINAYAPARGRPQNEYTVAAYEPAGAPRTVLLKRGVLLSVTARAPGVRYLIRGPKGAALDLNTTHGSINVADFDGVVNAHDDRGNVKMLIPQYGNVWVGSGNISVIFGSTDWPGTLRFTAVNGDVELYVNANAKAAIHLHTDRGTIFTDFPLKGTAAGQSETIDGVLGGGATRKVDVEVRSGSIRVMQLKPQI